MSTLQHEDARDSRADVFDPTRLGILLDMEDDGDAAMIKDIATQFVTDVLGVMDRIEKSLGAGDFARVASAAHTVKGSAATFGLFRVETVARELETCAKDPAKRESLPAVYESLRSAFAAGREALENYLAAR